MESGTRFPWQTITALRSSLCLTAELGDNRCWDLELVLVGLFVIIRKEKAGKREEMRQS